MRIAVFGATGQVGLGLAAAARLSPDIAVIPIRRADADLLTKGAAADAVLRAKPDAVINAAAYTAVDKAESQREAAFRVNAEAAGEIAEAARAVGARLVHLSTDYVFPGEGGVPIAEDAPTAPVNVYGESKLKGEEVARAAHPGAVVLRTSWVFSGHGANFVKTMLRLAETRTEVRIVADQVGGPTSAAAIASACLNIAARKDGPSGAYHLQGAPAASWADFAEAIFAAAGKAVKVDRIETSAYPTPARRPLYTVLDCSKILRDYGIGQPDWRGDAARTVERLMRERAEKAS